MSIKQDYIHVFIVFFMFKLGLYVTLDSYSSFSVEKIRTNLPYVFTDVVGQLAEMVRRNYNKMPSK